MKKLLFITLSIIMMSACKSDKEKDPAGPSTYSIKIYSPTKEPITVYTVDVWGEWGKESTRKNIASGGYNEVNWGKQMDEIIVKDVQHGQYIDVRACAEKMPVSLTIKKNSAVIFDKNDRRCADFAEQNN